MRVPANPFLNNGTSGGKRRGHAESDSPSDQQGEHSGSDAIPETERGIGPAMHADVESGRIAMAGSYKCAHVSRSVDGETH